MPPLLLGSGSEGACQHSAWRTVQLCTYRFSAALGRRGTQQQQQQQQQLCTITTTHEGACMFPSAAIYSAVSGTAHTTHEGHASLHAVGEAWVCRCVLSQSCDCVSIVSVVDWKASAGLCCAKSAQYDILAAANASTPLTSYQGRKGNACGIGGAQANRVSMSGLFHPEDVHTCS
eukprot:jgi/Mesvir1/25381/Mv25652-RA.1